MPKEIFISLEEAAQAEGITYEAMKKRVQRAPKDFKSRIRTDSGGKERVQVAVSSLSPKGRRAYRKAQDVEKGGAEEVEEGKARPWYVDVDHNWYIENNRERYQEAVRLAEQLRAYLDYGEAERTAYAQQTADRLGLSLRTLYRYADSVLEAEAWTRRLEAEDGIGRPHLCALALCRKPKTGGAFPSLSPEQKALIENIWFNKTFADNSRGKAGAKELLYDIFQEQAERQQWVGYPSSRTVARYINHLMEQPKALSAHTLAADGFRGWENQMQHKGQRDTSTLEVMEYVVADSHTCDFWVQVTAPNGKVRAIRPILVAWMDVRSRRILGAILCERPNTQIIKLSFIKMCIEAGTVPRHVHTDNGKDYANKETLGQDRNLRAFGESLMDAEFKGFYLAMGAQDWSRSLPYKPWDKHIERFFGTLSMKFSRRFASYTGTMTGSDTAAKRNKDIPRMLERGELMTLEEAMGLIDQYFTRYEARVHRGLKKVEQEWYTPIAVWENAERYERPLPAREYMSMLMMKSAQAQVNAQGITRFKTLYTAPELGFYNKKRVGIRWDPDDITKLYVYDKDGRKICEAYSAELLQMGDRVSQDGLEGLHKEKRRLLRETKEYLEEMNKPFVERIASERAQPAGKPEFIYGHAPARKVVALPADKEYRGEMAARTTKRKAQAGNAFFSRKADEALASLRAMNE